MMSSDAGVEPATVQLEFQRGVAPGANPEGSGSLDTADYRHDHRAIDEPR